MNTPPPATIPVLMVSEVFGPTIQGEGPLVGWPAIFLRLMGCNLACSWCDTPYTWDGSRYDLRSEVKKMTAQEVAVRIAARGPYLLVISGGEPLLQQHRLVDLLDLLDEKRRVQVETAGTIVPMLDDDVEYVVSPKLAHSGNAVQLRYRPEAIDALRERRVLGWKFVLQGPADYGEVDQLVERHGLWPVYIMPEGTTSAVLWQRVNALLPGAIERGYVIAPRLHIDFYGNERGH